MSKQYHINYIKNLPVKFQKQTFIINSEHEIQVGDRIDFSWSILEDVSQTIIVGQLKVTSRRFNARFYNTNLNDLKEQSFITIQKLYLNVTLEETATVHHYADYRLPVFSELTLKQLNEQVK